MIKRLHSLALSALATTLVACSAALAASASVPLASWDGPQSAGGWVISDRANVSIKRDADGSSYASVSNPIASDGATISITYDLPLDQLHGTDIVVSVEVRANNVTKPAHPWNGVKAMVHVVSPSASETYDGADANGSVFPFSYDWKKLEFRTIVPADATHATLILGLQDSAGRADFRNPSVSIVPAALSLSKCSRGLAPVRLWDGAAPGAKGDTEFDIPRIFPMLTSVSADNKPNAAIVVCPGGAYTGVALGNEGFDYAKWLNLHGICAFVLEYRLGSHGYRNPIEQGDVDRAIRLVRSRAAEWGVDPARVGVMGSSAGGHLAATVLTHNDPGDPNAADPIDRQSCRPDFGVLCYPVITMMGPYAHWLCRHQLLGDNPSDSDENLLSAEKQVTSNTPATFVWCPADDKEVPSMNSLLFAEALAKNKVPYELHIYAHGVHGTGLGDATFPFSNALPWASDLLRWLTAMGISRNVN